MHMKKVYECLSCGKRPLVKDEVGASMKFLGEHTTVFYCIDCLAEYLDSTPEDIQEKIELFKEDGCKLFR